MIPNLLVGWFDLAVPTGDMGGEEEAEGTALEGRETGKAAGGAMNCCQ